MELSMAIEITNPQIEDYLKTLYDGNDPVRHEMEELARRHSFPIVGPLAGRHLYQLTRMIGARRVFELGSGYGYSALHFSRAVGEGGQVHCTDLSHDNIELARRFLTQAGLWDRITYHQEEATAALSRVGGVWDIIYNDIDKEDYPATIELAYEHLRPGGLFITDNVLWSGQVLAEHRDGSTSTQSIIEFTNRLFAHPGFITSIYPVRDGLTVALRL
jgi:predicted O-methyltransferase YrrM